MFPVVKHWRIFKTLTTGARVATVLFNPTLKIPNSSSLSLGLTVLFSSDNRLMLLQDNQGFSCNVTENSVFWDPADIVNFIIL